jgi:Aminoglycoside-2''-adenylyltransferase
VAKFEDLVETLRRTALILQEADVPFVLGGGLASWARGGPETEHDLDVMVKPEDAERALEAFAAAGLETEKPPEQWLYKAWDGEVLIDVIFAPKGGPPSTTGSSGARSRWRSQPWAWRSWPSRT